MSKQSENLTIIHLHIDALDSLEATSVSFLEVQDAKVVACIFESFANQWRRFVILSRHLRALKGIIFIGNQELVLLAFINLLEIVIAPPAAPIVARHETETGMKSLTKITRHHLVKVESQEEKEQKVESHHVESNIERVLLVDYVGS